MRRSKLTTGFAVLVATLTIAPAIARADDCISGRFSWVIAAPAGKTRYVAAQFTDTVDAENWVGYAALAFNYVPGHIGFAPRLQANGSESFSDRTFCRNASGFCDTNGFDAFNPDTIRIDLISGTNLNYSNSTWNYTKNASGYQCVNSNTVAFNVGDRTFVMALRNVEAPVQGPPQ